jgi:hypothetical protein
MHVAYAATLVEEVKVNVVASDLTRVAVDLQVDALARPVRVGLLCCARHAVAA